MKWTKIDGIVYKTNEHNEVNTFVLCKIVNEDVQLAEPVVCFGLIQDILVLNSNSVFFLTRVYRSCMFDNHYHGYIVKETSEQLLLPQESLLDPTVLHGHSVDCNIFISFKYHIEIH